MNMFEEARSFRDMMKARDITQSKLADFLGVDFEAFISQTTSNALNVLRLSS